ncbi:lipase [Pseudonocardia xishanensis]|uniref:Lipase n=1 Tax=Pseudonocardia xishanensis TaxID=630995 RepID=A0ABP8RPE4_9PSEU
MGGTVLRVGAAVVVVVGLVVGVYAALTGATLRPVVAAPPAAQATGTTGPPPPAFAPVDRAGPALTVPAADLAASLECTRARANRDTVLLLSGTGADPATAYSWGVRPVLTAAGFATCLSTAPERNTGDIAVRAQYVVHAIRTIAADTGRKVAVVGHSQGGVVVRWALRFWPDLRPLVSDVVALGPPNAGTTAFTCPPACSAADRQQAAGSAFVEALNSGAQTFPGIDYSVVVSTDDVVVTPPATASTLLGVPTVSVQQVCPGRRTDHGALGLSDAVSLGLVVDALRNPGPADPARIRQSTCAAAQAAGITAAALRRGTAAVRAEVDLPRTAVSEEPAPPCYTRDTPC